MSDIADDAGKLGRVRGWLLAGITEAGSPLGDMVKHLAAERLDGAERAHRCQQAELSRPPVAAEESVGQDA